MTDVNDWPTCKVVSAEIKCFNGLQRCCLQHAVKPQKVLVSSASQAIVFESLSTIMVPLCPHCFNPAFFFLNDPCTEEFPELHIAPYQIANGNSDAMLERPHNGSI
jgi:hypothetical protein